MSEYLYHSHRVHTLNFIGQMLRLPLRNRHSATIYQSRKTLPSLLHTNGCPRPRMLLGMGVDSGVVVNATDDRWP